MFIKTNQPKVYAEPVAQPVHYYLYSEITPYMDDYVEMIHHLDCAMQGEHIHIHLATPGGSMESAIAIVHSINRSNATVIGHADATVASAGTMIFLACHAWNVYQYSSFMFHDGSLGTPPMKFNESQKMIRHTIQMYSDMCHDIYGKIMEHDEIENIINGSDHYMRYEEMVDRLQDYSDKEAAKNNEADIELLRETLRKLEEEDPEPDSLIEEDDPDYLTTDGKDDNVNPHGEVVYKGENNGSQSDD